MKRNHTSPEKSNPSKKSKQTNNPNSQCVDFPVEVVECPWKNLELILSIQSKELRVKEKVELAFSFVKAHGKGEKGAEEECQAVKISLLVIFLSDWIQSLLISTQKSLQVNGDLDSGPCLDFRCWEIFSFCLKHSSILGVSIKLSRNLLKAIGFVAKNLLSEQFFVF